MDRFPGKLKITVLKASIKRITEGDAKDMDPYVQLQLGEKMHKTDVKKDGGQSPEWN